MAAADLPPVSAARDIRDAIFAAISSLDSGVSSFWMGITDTRGFCDGRGKDIAESSVGNESSSSSESPPSSPTAPPPPAQPTTVADYTGLPAGGQYDQSTGQTIYILPDGARWQMMSDGSFTKL